MAEQVGPATAGSVVTSRGAVGASGRATGDRSTDRPDGGAGPAPFVSQVPGVPVHFAHFSGRPVSWVAVSLILSGFVAGGLGLVFHVWWLFWVACGVAGTGGLLAIATGIFDDWY